MSRQNRLRGVGLAVFMTATMAIWLGAASVGCAQEVADEQTLSAVESTESPSPETPSPETPSPETPSPETPSTETPSTETPSTETPSTETPSTETPSTETPSTETPSTETPSTGEDALAPDSESDAAPEEDGIPQEEASEPQTETSDAEEGEVAPPAVPFNWGLALMVLASLAVPIMLGNWLAQRFKMPDHAWKISVILLAISVSALSVATGKFKFGPDLAGGVTLIYEVADKDRIDTSDSNDPSNGPRDSARKGVSIDQMIDALMQRIDPSGTKEVSIRKFGDVIEIIVPRASQEDLEFVKRRITDLGQLEFRITADPRWKKDQPIIEAAKLLRPAERLVKVGGQVRAKWVLYEEREFGTLEQQDDRVVKRRAGSRNEVLVLVDNMNVTGEYLASVSVGVDSTGGPAVDFTFNSQGSARFGKLTGENLPNPATKVSRYLGILLDERLVSAPSIRERISGRGQISGGAMTEEEVNHTVSILNAGSLPAALNKTPISEEVTSAELGAATIEKGKFAIGASLGVVLIFILFYYRFAGIVSCLALAANLLLVLGVMVLIQAAFTLPGLAGLVLTVGMSVDANVLIFERIREELNRGSALRMAIRNGFARATTTIVDANVTTLITGVVLYTIGTGPIKGFAITLILGILMSMFTAIFCARVVFDIAERRRWIKQLHLSSLIGTTDFNFIGKRLPAAVLSCVIILTGLFGVYSRQSSLLNIDFTGGTSVTTVFKEGLALPVSEVDAALRDLQVTDETGASTGPLGERNLLVVAAGSSEGAVGNRFTIKSSVESVEMIQKLVQKAFDDKLQTFEVVASGSEPFAEGDYQGTEVALAFNEADAFGEYDGLAHDPLLEHVERIVAQQGHEGLQVQLENDDYLPGSSQRFKQWSLRLGGLEQEAADAVVEHLRSDLGSTPLFPQANKIGGRVAGDMQFKAIQAIGVSLVLIVAYLWFRFQNVSFGLAAVVALLHDVLVTLGAIALSAYVVNSAAPIATALQIDSFQISLAMLAAFLTIIGYSLNDTIVVFDRIREVRGKSPNLTAGMVNKSINQTLSRTLLTSVTTLVVVVILFLFGGAGIHGFAFALVIGVIVGTYSSIFVAAPTLLALIGTEETKTEKNAKPAAGAA